MFSFIRNLQNLQIPSAKINEISVAKITIISFI